MNETAQEVKLIEDFERSWPSRRKNELVERVISGETCISLAWEHGPLKIVVWAIVGVRGGMNEQILAVDSSVTRSVIDRLIVSRRVVGDIGGSGFFLPLYEMRRRKRKERAAPIELCRAEMRRLMERVVRDPEHLASILRDKALSTDESIAAVSGGLPSLGWASR